MIKDYIAKAYAAHENMVAPARRPRAGLRFVLGVMALGILYAVISGLYVYILERLCNVYLMPFYDSNLRMLPQTMYIMLGAFAFLTLSAFVVVWFIHNRSPLSLLGGLARALGDFWRSMRVLLPVLALMAGLTVLGYDLVPNMPFGQWLLLLPLSLIAVLIQTSAEEIAFRGYLQSHIAALAPNPILWMVIPSVLFGLLHYDPALGENAKWIVLWATGFGLLAADLTARSGNLGPAIALHFGNNVVAILIFSLQGHMDGLALTNIPFSAYDEDAFLKAMPFEFLAMICAYCAVRIGIRR